MSYANEQEATQTETAGIDLMAAERNSSWAVVLGARIFQDGNEWCVLYGEDLMSGIAAFGDTPEKAIAAFEVAMSAPATLPAEEQSP